MNNGSNTEKNIGDINNIKSEEFISKLSTPDYVISEQEDTILLTFRVAISHDLYPRLNILHSLSEVCVSRMLKNRKNTSSKHYKEIPCILSKSLARKYQRNKKLKQVKNLVLPVCATECGVKIVKNNLYINSFFKKAPIKLVFPKPIIGKVRHLEFFKKDKKWYMSYCYHVAKSTSRQIDFLGVDRNTTGNVVAVANLGTGKASKIGPDVSIISKEFRNRRTKLQKKGAKNALKKIKGKQARKVKDINHKVSRTIVNRAKDTSSVIVLENLKSINKGKASRYVKKSQWPFYQLEQFIKYKAALLGIPIAYVDPRYTSKGCSKCGEINLPNNKVYRCSKCGHVEHRDVNAAFNIAERCVFQGGVERVVPSGYIGKPPNLTTSKVVEQELLGGVQ